MRQALNQESDEEEEADSNTPSSQGLTSDGSSPDSQLIFGRGSYSTDLRSFHPPAVHATALANVFFSRVDPIFKVLHRPTILTIVQTNALGQRNIPNKSHEAISLAIYFSAVTSLSDEECSVMFHQDRKALVAQYKNGTEAALVNADLLNTSELMILQALCLYLVSIYPCTRSIHLLQYSLTYFAWPRKL